MIITLLNILYLVDPVLDCVDDRLKSFRFVNLASDHFFQSCNLLAQFATLGQLRLVLDNQPTVQLLTKREGQTNG